jgi:REP element-mobilizing transposase RayT
VRRTRTLKDGAWYHIIARINRGECIFNNEEIKLLFLKIVVRAKNNKKHPYRFEIANFCIMGNHIHFLLKPAHGESLSKIMQWILSVFAIHYNKRANIKGHVWYDRFKSIIINSLQQFISTFEYITNNPIKAGLCSSASEYKYCGQYFISIKDFSLIEKNQVF